MGLQLAQILGVKMSNSRTALALGLCLACYFPVAHSEKVSQKALLGKTLMVAIECGQFASYAQIPGRSAQLYSFGIESARTFIEAWKRAEISQKEIREIVPMIVSDTVRDGGPSTDFIVGRLFETITGHASDQVIKLDSRSMPLDMDKWRFEPDLQKSIAETKYQQRNCWMVGQK